ncbi:S1 RNA-binding domain-containing protein [Streptomyces sp. MST-110588]|uniref:S1 RNA-binding domain-containing protein n=1 Tax=Streptomyces sp. MST-110588 TaxID=2833628 RepID=UPI001F5E0327|nr:S1 RNA-binding domain-containing protein [Streptomyces sp. MST-110588]UNO43533.1 S1 RNA-binding domain-containing protein [Streptomyces sp. MST-110588]
MPLTVRDGGGPHQDQALRTFLLGLRLGARHEGTVESAHTFGVFVRLDGEPDRRCTGFITIPELSWSRISRPSDVVTAGQRVTGEILDVDVWRGQVRLSLKALQEDPLVRFAGRVGHTLSGQVTKVVPFGVFVRVAEGIEGLLPLCEVLRGFGRVSGTSDLTDQSERIIGEGDEVAVGVAAVDLVRRRVMLTRAW